MVAGTDAEPAVWARSVHHLMKVVAGVPLQRPAWFFDVAETGEGLADVGTHVADLVQWTAFPDQTLDYRTDVQILGCHHWPTLISRRNFERVTGEPDFPGFLAGAVNNGDFEYFCNNSVHYALRGVHVRLEILWTWEAPPATGDTYEAAFRGTKSRIEIRQGKAERYIPELYVVPESAEIFAALKSKVEALQLRYPGLAVGENGAEARIVIPDRFRVGHEAHFAQVTNKFAEYFQSPQSVPAWEKANMLVKYFVTTRAVEAARSYPGS